MQCFLVFHAFAIGQQFLEKFSDIKMYTICRKCFRCVFRNVAISDLTFGIKNNLHKICTVLYFCINECNYEINSKIPFLIGIKSENSFKSVNAKDFFNL